MNAIPNLHGRVVALSMSPPADLGRLGFPTTEFDQVVFNLCMRVIRAQGRILFGGHLQEGGITARMFECIAHAYAPPALREGGRMAKPFLHLLPLSEFRRVSFARVFEIQSQFGSFLETRVIVDENVHLSVSRRSDKLTIHDTEGKRAPFIIDTPADFAKFSSDLPTRREADALTAMRNAARILTRARIALGGKRGDLGVSGDRDRFFGAMPGIYEETISSIESRTPFVVLGAYGGAARDVAIDLGLIDPNLETPYLGEIQPDYGDARARMREMGRELSQADRDTAVEFVLREDCEVLARDVIAVIARRLEPSQTRFR